MTVHPEPERNADPVLFQARVGGTDRMPAVAAALVIVFLALAIAKPWQVDRSPAAAPGGLPGVHPRVVTKPTPSNGPSASSLVATDGPAAVADLCLEPGSWRTATIETWSDRTVRVWRAIEPGPASGPHDQSIPIVPAVGSLIPAIGFCAPGEGPQQPTGPVDVDAWRLDGSRATSIRLRQVEPIGRFSAYGALYGPPSGRVGTSSWSNGVVVFRYSERSSGIERWFGIEIRGVLTDGSRDDSAASAGFLQ